MNITADIVREIVKSIDPNLIVDDFTPPTPASANLCVRLYRKADDPQTILGFIDISAITSAVSYEEGDNTFIWMADSFMVNIDNPIVSIEGAQKIVKIDLSNPNSIEEMKLVIMDCVQEVHTYYESVNQPSEFVIDLHERPDEHN